MNLPDVSPQPLVDLKVYFHPTDREIRVERVLYGSQDIDLLFFT